MEILDNEGNLQKILDEESISKDDTFKFKSSYGLIEENKGLLLNFDSN